MKTKFIEETDKQYSIREDGKVIRHYKWLGRKEYGHQEFKDLIISYKKHPKRDCKYIVVRSNGKTFNFFANSLLSKYFGFIICPECKKSIQTDVHLRKCKSCVKSNEYEARMNWRSKNKNAVLKSQRKNYLKNIDHYRSKHNKKTHDLHDDYLANKIKVKKEYLSKELLGLKRNQLKLHRELKNYKKNDTNK